MRSAPILYTGRSRSRRQPPQENVHVHTTLRVRRSGSSLMPYRQRHGENRAPSTPSADDTEAYRLIAIRPADAPAGCAGRDWLVYEIAQGANVITGYRRGDLPSATADVEKIVVALNERRAKSKGRPGPKPKQAASAGRGGAARSSADHDPDGAGGDRHDAAAEGSGERATTAETDSSDEADSA